MRTRLSQRPHEFAGDPGGTCAWVTRESWGPGDKHEQEHCGLLEDDPVHAGDPLAVAPNDFACRCSDKGKERIARIRAWAEERERVPVTDPLFLTRLIHDLNWNYRVSIEGIPTDMWSAIIAEGPEEFKTWMQCDEILDGLIFVLRAAYDQFGDKYKEAEGLD